MLYDVMVSKKEEGRSKEKFRAKGREKGRLKGKILLPRFETRHEDKG